MAGFFARPFGALCHIAFAPDFGRGGGGMPPRGPQLRALRPGAETYPSHPQSHAAAQGRGQGQVGQPHAFAAYGARPPMSPKAQLAAQKAAEKAATKAAKTAQRAALKAQPKPVSAQGAPKRGFFARLSGPATSASQSSGSPMSGPAMSGPTMSRAPMSGAAMSGAATSGPTISGATLTRPPLSNPALSGVSHLGPAHSGVKMNAPTISSAGVADAPMSGGQMPGGHSGGRAPHSMARRDPAPSRMAYRLQRLWLTPLFRAFARVGVPVFCVVLGLGLWLGDDGRRADLVARYDDVVRKVQERPEFMVSLLKVEGASPEVDAAIRAMMPVKLPASSFQIDLEALHEVITRLDAVAEAKLVIRDGGTLDVIVTERQPAILWRHATGIEMLDMDGHRVATLLDRAARPDLPLVAGQGAETSVAEALELLAAAGPILPRARGMVRVGERRWDIVLDRGQRILLPEENPVLAVERLLAIDAAEDLMGRDFTILDLRNQDRPTIRLSEAALTEFRTIKGFEIKVKK